MIKKALTTPINGLAKRIGHLEPEMAFEYLNIANNMKKRGKEVVSFGIGQPDFPTPQPICDAAIKAINEGYTGYVSAQGIPELRDAIARYISEWIGGAVKAEEVIVTPGCKTAIYFAILGYIERGDEVIIPDPSFFAYGSLVKYAGGCPVYIPLDEKHNFRTIPEYIAQAITNKTKMIILTSPHNPTGGVNTEKDLKGILELAKENNILIVCDEIYDHYVYDGAHASILTNSDWRDYVIYLNGFSKTYAMTGWRLGYALARKEVIQRFAVFAMNNFSCTNNFIQRAAVTALEMSQDFFKNILKEFKQRRDFIYTKLNKIAGISATKPRGSFYIFPNVKELLKERGLTTSEFTRKLLMEKGVVTLPGYPAFPFKAGDGYLRLAFTIPIEQMEKGFEKIQEF